MEKNWQEFFDKREWLDTLAQEDAYYNAWKKGFEEDSVKFHKFVKFMPKSVRAFLFGYADGQRMMLERKINIACMCMEKTDKTPQEWREEILTEIAEKKGL